MIRARRDKLVLASWCHEPGSQLACCRAVAIGSQLADLTGIEADDSLYATDIGAVLRNLDMLDWPTFFIGAGSIAVILLVKRFTPAIPGALVAVGLATAVTVLADLDIAAVGEFASGIPIPGIPDISLSDIGALIGPAFAIALLVYPDSVLTGRSLATLNNYRLDADAEFFGIGAANIGAGLLQGPEYAPRSATSSTRARSSRESEPTGSSSRSTTVSSRFSSGLPILTDHEPGSLFLRGRVAQETRPPMLPPIRLPMTTSPG